MYCKFPMRVLDISTGQTQVTPCTWHTERSPISAYLNEHRKRAHGLRLNAADLTSTAEFILRTTGKKFKTVRSRRAKPRILKPQDLAFQREAFWRATTLPKVMVEVIESQPAIDSITASEMKENSLTVVGGILTPKSLTRRE